MRQQNDQNFYKSVSMFRQLLLCCCVFTVTGVSAEALTIAIEGEKTFMKYCAGCHGYDGMAVYEHAPSFAKGERLHKTDSQLLYSVLNGKNNMPPWRDKLPVNDLRYALAYIRLLHERHTNGEPLPRNNKAGIYYLFKPVGELNMDWKTKQD